MAWILLYTFSWLAVSSVHSLIPVQFQGWLLFRCRHTCLICGLSQGVGGRAEQGVLPPAGPQVVLPARSRVGQQSCCAQAGMEGRADLAGWLGWGECRSGGRGSLCPLPVFLTFCHPFKVPASCPFVCSSSPGRFLSWFLSIVLLLLHTTPIASINKIYHSGSQSIIFSIILSISETKDRVFHVPFILLWSICFRQFIFMLHVLFFPILLFDTEAVDINPAKAMYCFHFLKCIYLLQMFGFYFIWSLKKKNPLENCSYSVWFKKKKATHLFMKFTVYYLKG